MDHFKSFKKSFIFDFPNENFLTTLTKETITGIHVIKKVIVNNIEFDDNFRITTNKNFVIEILKRQLDTEFVYKIIFEDKKIAKHPTGFSDDYDGLVQFLNFATS